MKLLDVELNELSATSWSRSVDDYEFHLTIDRKGDFVAKLAHSPSNLRVTAQGEHLSEVESDLRGQLEYILGSVQGAMTVGKRTALVPTQRSQFLRHVHERLAQKVTLEDIQLSGNTWTFKVPVAKGMVTLQWTSRGDPYSKETAWDVAHKVLSYLSKIHPLKWD